MLGKFEGQVKKANHVQYSSENSFDLENYLKGPVAFKWSMDHTLKITGLDQGLHPAKSNIS